MRRSARLCSQGGPAGQGIALPRSVPLPSLGRQQSGCPWRRSGHGGRGPHTAPVHARLLSPGTVRVAPLCVGAGSLVHRGSCGSRRLGRAGGPCSSLPRGRRSLAGGRGDHPLCLGGGLGGRHPPVLRVGGEGGGTGEGGRAMAPHLPLWGGRPAALCPVPPSSPAHPSQVYAFGRGRGAAPGAGCGLPPAGQPGGGGGEGRPVRRPPGGVAGGHGGRGFALPRSVPLPSLGGQQCGRHWRRSGLRGRGPNTAPVCCRVPPPGVARVSFLCAGAGLPACRDPRGSRRWGTRGRAACRSSCAPLRASQILKGEGGRPLGLRGGGGPAPPWPAGNGGGVGREARGGRAAVPHPPALGGWPVAPVPVPLLPRRTPPGYTRSAGVAGRPWAPGAGWSAAGGSVWRGGGGREVSLPRSAPPPSPGGHQGEPLLLRIPGCRGSVAARGAGTEPPVGRR